MTWVALLLFLIVLSASIYMAYREEKDLKQKMDEYYKDKDRLKILMYLCHTCPTDNSYNGCVGERCGIYREIESYRIKLKIQNACKDLPYATINDKNK